MYPELPVTPPVFMALQLSSFLGRWVGKLCSPCSVTSPSLGPGSSAGVCPLVSMVVPFWWLVILDCGLCSTSPLGHLLLVLVQLCRVGLSSCWILALSGLGGAWGMGRAGLWLLYLPVCSSNLGNFCLPRYPPPPPAWACQEIADKPCVHCCWPSAVCSPRSWITELAVADLFSLDLSFLCKRGPFVLKVAILVWKLDSSLY